MSHYEVVAGTLIEGDLYVADERPVVAVDTVGCD